MSEWNEVKLSDISTQKKGINYKSENYCAKEFGYPFITIKCFVKGGGYEPKGIKYYNGPYTKADQLNQDDILFSITDLTRAGDIVGSPLKVPFFGENLFALGSMDCMKIQPDISLCDGSFLYHRMMLSDIRRQMVAYSAGSTVLHLDTKQVPKMRIKIPNNIFTQNKIANILDTNDQAIEKTEALIEKYQQIKTGIMQDLFTRGIGVDGKLRPTREQAPELYHETQIGWIPKDWSFDSLKNIFGAKSIVNGPFGSDLLTTELHLEGIPVLYCQDIKPNKFNRVSNSNVTPIKAAQLSFCNVKTQDILLAKVGAPPCDSCVYEDEENAIVTQDVIRIRPLSTHNPYYFSSWFNSNNGRKAVRKISIEGTRERVSLGEYKSLLMPLPVIKEQILIGERIKSIQDLINREIDALNKYKKEKLGLMEDLLTGKRPVDAIETAHV